MQNDIYLYNQQFKLLDEHRGAGASESMSIGSHLEEELPNSEPKSFKSEISSDQLQSMEIVSQPEVSNKSLLISLDFLANFVSVRS